MAETPRDLLPEPASDEPPRAPGAEPPHAPGTEPPRAPGAEPPREASGESPRSAAALVAILAGVCAALHVGKLPPAIAALQAALGMSLVQAGLLLSMVQLAGMAAGLAFGALADRLGARRSMLLGLGALAVLSAAGAWAHSAAALMLLRAFEGFGFLLVVLAAPALVRRLVAPARLNLVLGAWGAYMPLGTMLALLAGPGMVAGWGWPAWWLCLGVASAAMAAWLAWAVPAEAKPAARIAGPRALRPQLAHTVRSRGPWLVSLAFAAYSFQWLAVIGFLPTLTAAAGASVALTGVLSAAVAAANMVGNLAAGRLLHGGVRATRLLRVGYGTMAVCALAAFAQAPGGEPLLPAPLRYVAALGFSGVGGLVPATLFALAVPATPRAGSLSATVGWMQQWSACGQFAGPPLAAWVAAAAGGWHFTWVVTGASALAGLALTAGIGHFVNRPHQVAPDGPVAPGR